MSEGKIVGKFWFNEEVPKKVFDICKPILLANEKLIPDWCKQVRVYWQTESIENMEGEETCAHIDVSYSYRIASLYICSSFLLEPDWAKETTIKHELWHIVSLPLINHVREIVELITKEDEKLKDILDYQLMEKMESLTEDLTNILKKIEK